jgi:hypothetical protein
MEMQKMKTKLEERLVNLHDSMEELSESIQKNLPKKSEKEVEKSVVLGIGNKAETLRGMLNQFINTMDIYLNIAGGVLSDLPENVIEFYSTYSELVKPISAEDSKEVKELKEQILKIKQNVK